MSSSIDYTGQSPSPKSSNDRRKLECLFVAQHSSCFQKELKKEYDLTQVGSKKKQRIKKSPNRKVEDLNYSPSEVRNSQLSSLKDTFQRAHIFQESPLSIKHLDSFAEQDIKIPHDLYNNDSSKNLNKPYSNIFKANSVDITDRKGKKSTHMKFNGIQLKLKQLDEGKNKQQSNTQRVQPSDQDFFFTTASVDFNKQEDNSSPQSKRKSKKIKNEVSIADLKSNIQEDQNEQINSSLYQKSDHKRSIESISKKINTRQESYQTRQSRKLLKLPKLQNNLSKSLLQSYRECQQSMEELGSLERSISQVSIYQYDLALPQNQERLLNQRKKWEYKALDYIKDNKYQDYQDKKKFQIFREGIDKKIHRYFIDEEQKKKNILIQKMERVLKENQKQSYINEQRKDHFKDEQFQHKYGIAPREKYGSRVANTIDLNQNLYSPDFDSKPPPLSSRRASPYSENTQQSKQIFPKKLRKQNQDISYQELLKDEIEGSLNEMLTNKLSSISYSKRKQNNKQQDVEETIKIIKNISQINRISFPQQDFLSNKKQQPQTLDSPRKNTSPKNRNTILQEELVDLNSPITFTRNRRYLM